MRGLRSYSTVLVLGLATPVAALAQSVGDPQRGLRLAEQQCADCHFVEKGSGHSPVPPAPSFENIANISGMTAMALTAALRTTHATMPNVVVKGSDISDLVAYILSLKSGG
jgi:mono/diheme cytochrome c family protein